MALKDNWIDRQNGIDDVDSEDINEVAHAVIDLEKTVFEEIKAALEEIKAALEESAVLDEAILDLSTLA